MRIDESSLRDHALTRWTPWSSGGPIFRSGWLNLVFCLGALTYALLLAGLASRTSLWVDEILQLLGTRDEPTISGLLRWVMINPGGAPLGYLTQRAAIGLLGYSLLVARLPSIICGVLSCIGIVFMCRQLNLTSGRLAAVLFATSPLVFRYGFEARPYSQGLLISIATSMLCLWFQSAPGWRRMALYVTAVALGLYTQPFTVFLPIGQVAAVLFYRSAYKSRLNLAWRTTIAVLLGCVLFLPWVFITHGQWRTNIAAGHYAVSFNASLASVILRELGGTYFITSLLIAAAVTALAGQQTPHRAKVILVTTIVTPVLGALVADAVFGYFFAVRQVLFVLPPLTILASEGSSRLFRIRRSWGAVVFLATLFASLYQDVRMVLKPREDWQAASRKIISMIGPNSCFLAAPAEWTPLYGFFEPALKTHQCTPDVLLSAEEVVLAITPYTSRDDIRGALARTASAGVSNPQAEQSIGGTRIRVFRR